MGTYKDASKPMVSNQIKSYHHILALANLLMRLVVVVGVDWRLDGVLDQFLECSTLAYELNELRNASTAAEHD